ncbi:MAG: CopD family protein [Solirubrobacterales bacterium]
MRRLTFRLAVCVAASLIACLAAALPAAAHAQLESTVPARDATLERAPAFVEFRFGEPVEAAFGSVRVYDESGTRVDRGGVLRPDGDSSIAVRTRPGLGDGSYTATYRVVSADSHPVSGGFVFHVGETARPPTRSVASYLASAQPPRTTVVAYVAVRFAGYLALCLLFGFVFFDAFVFGPSARRVGSAAADSAFARRAAAIEGVGVALGVAAAALAIVFQAAIAAGEGALSAVGSGAVGEVLETRSGGWMLARLGIWLAIALVWTLFVRRSPRAGLAAMLALGALAAQTPALIGHAAVTSPVWLMIGFDFIHVVAMSVWVGGLAAGLLALPCATATLVPAARTSLLVECFDRFSRFALVCVCALIVTGVGQSLVQFDSFDELASTAYGRAIVIKAALLVALIVLAAINRQRALPRLRLLAERGDAPGDAGRLLRRTLGAELALTIGAIAVASALVGYAPAKAAAGGPFVGEGRLGPAQLQLIVDPARSGPNQLHMYLSDPASGAQFTSYKELRVSIERAKPQLGPIELQPSRAGPGHFVVPDVRFPGAGDWRVTVTMRTSEFDEYQKSFAVKIRGAPRV